MTELHKTMLAALIDSMGDDDPASLQRLIETFIQDSALQFDAMRLALRQRDGRTLFRACHSLKSTAAIFGGWTLSAMAASIVEQTRDGLPDYNLEPQIDALAHEHQVLVETMRQLSEELSHVSAG